MSSQEQWSAVDRYLEDLLIPIDPALQAALKASADAGLPEIQVTPTQGKLLHLLARLQGARNILEIGTLGAYSTIWLARALPSDGRLITLELDPHHAEIARKNLARANLANLVDLRVGPASQNLAHLTQQRPEPFDLIFLDADKQSYPDYLQWSLKLARPGTLIIADNVVRKGAVLDASSTDASVQGVRRFLEMVSREPRLSATAIQTVGAKGYDGFVLARVGS